MVCRNAIEDVICEHYRENVLGIGAAAQVTEQFGKARVQHILAVTVRHKKWDAPFLPVTKLGILVCVEKGKKKEASTSGILEVDATNCNNESLI